MKRSLNQMKSDLKQAATYYAIKKHPPKPFCDCELPNYEIEAHVIGNSPTYAKKNPRPELLVVHHCTKCDKRSEAAKAEKFLPEKRIKEVTGEDQK